MNKTTEPDFFATDALPARTPGQPAFRLDIRRALAMHPTLAAVTAILVAGTLLLGGVLLKTQYKATAIFSVSPVVTAVLPISGIAPSSDVTQFDSTMQQAVETLLRADTAEAAVRSLPPGVWRGPNESVAAAAERLQRSLSASRVGTSLQISAALTGPRAGDTAEAMSAVAAQFLKIVHREEDGRATERIQLLKEEAARVESNLDTDRAAASQLAAEFGVSRLQDSEKTPIDQTVGDLRQELSDLRRAQSYAAAGLAQQGAGAGDEFSQNTTTSGLVAQINARKAQLQSQMAGMTAANPIYQQDVQELRSLDRELLSATERGDVEQQRRQTATRDRAVRGVTQEEARVERQLNQQSAVAAGTAAKLQRYSALNGEIAALQTRLAAVRDSISTTTLQANSPSRVMLAVAPTLAQPAVSSKRRLAMLGALPLGLLAGVLAAIVAQRQDKRIFLAGDLEQALGIRPMATFPAASDVSDTLADQGLLRVAGSIESAYLSNHSKTFVFTACSPDADVEELVFRVQAKLKELGYNALWLAAETLLRAERDFEEMYGRGPVGSDLRFSETDGRVGGTADGVAVQRLSWLKRDYDLVLIDAPPLLASALAEYAVRRTDVTILISESGVTTREELESASGLLEQLGTGGVGVVLQDVRLKHVAPEVKRRLQKAEELAAQAVTREPVDNDGAWQVLHAGTAEELHVPGDPVARSGMRRAASRTSQVTYMRAGEGRSGNKVQPYVENYDAGYDASFHEASDEREAYTSVTQD